MGTSTVFSWSALEVSVTIVSSVVVVVAAVSAFADVAFVTAAELVSCVAVSEIPMLSFAEQPANYGGTQN